MSQYLIPLVQKSKVDDRKQGLVKVLDIVNSELLILQEKQAAGKMTQEETQEEFKAAIKKASLFRERICLDS